MSKRLILCFDGMWDLPPEPVITRGPSNILPPYASCDLQSVASPETNVLKLYRSITPHGQDGRTQQKWYVSDSGAPWFRRFRPEPFGYGLDQTILEAHAYLAVTYEPGDQVFIYGFSRGAYVARSLVGWLSCSGLLSSTWLDPDCVSRVRSAIAADDHQHRPQEFAECLTDLVLAPSKHSIDDSYRLYRNLHNDAHTLGYEAIRRRGTQDIQIAVLGLWDTVGPLGIPTAALKWLNDRRYNFHDTELSAIVKRAYHALALDEHRVDYNATLWTSPALPGQSIEQCWFVGAHGDVGGSYQEQELAGIPLLWIQRKSFEAGLSIEGAAMQKEQDPFGPLHDSFVEYLGSFRKWFHSRFYRPVMQTGTNTETLDGSIRIRLLNNPEYRPNNEGLKSAITFR